MLGYQRRPGVDVEVGEFGRRLFFLLSLLLSVYPSELILLSEGHSARSLSLGLSLLFVLWFIVLGILPHSRLYTGNQMLFFLSIS